MGKESPPELEIRVQSAAYPQGTPAPAPALRTPAPTPAQRPQPQRRRLSRWRPWLVPLFVVVNAVMFVVTMYFNNCPETNDGHCFGKEQLGRFAFEPIKENPLLGPSSATLEKMGALDVSKVVHEHEGWRLFACIWLHAGVVHIFANMLSLLFVGIRLEQEFGFLKIGLLYVLSGFGGSLLSALFIKSSISVGASGALFGLLGGMLSELLTNWTIYANKCAALLTLLLVIAINLAVGLLPHVDNFAHIGGFVTGLLLGFVLLVRPQFGWVSKKNLPHGFHSSPVKSKYKICQYVLWTISAVCLIVWFTVGLTMLFRGVNANDNCNWCHYLSCVPTSKRNCSSSSSVIYCSLSQQGNYVNLTCDSTRRSSSYFLPNTTETRIRELCTQLCS